MTKVPVFNRDVLAGLLGMPEDLIHVHAVDAGGGFGRAGRVLPGGLPGSLARHPGCGGPSSGPRTGPSTWSRSTIPGSSGTGSRWRSIRAGRITGLRDDIVHDNGAYCRTHGIAVPELTVTNAARPLPGPRLPRPDPGGPHQQDPVRHLPGARPVRGHHGPRAALRRGRRPARPGPQPNCAAATCWGRGKCRIPGR